MRRKGCDTAGKGGRARGAGRSMGYPIPALRAMASARPASLDAMLALPGVGQANLERYGKAFLTVLADQR